MFRKRLNKKNRGYKYSAKDYSNPFFNKKSQGARSRSSYNFSGKIKIILFVLLIMAVLLVYFFFFSKYFEIKNTEINGEGGVDKNMVESIITEQINDNLYIFLPQKNIFLFNEKELARRLETKYSFDFLNIKKDLPNKIIVEYREKKYSIIWTEDEKYYYTDKEGYVITETNVLEISEKNYPLVENQKDSRIYNNQVPLEQSYINYIINLYKSFKDYNEFKIEKFIVDSDINTAKLKLIDGPQVFFNINEAIDKQINKLQVVKTEKIKDDFSKKEYIDVRYGDSVYYR